MEPEDEVEELVIAEKAIDEHNGSRPSSVPTDVIHDHDPDLELFPSDTETL